ncbi:hypothetical protein [Deminuibacter soli]|uniref:Uncharacterized protein n=1 Tax=Deminuibacter soli TaxID=2291815 RepID=A0A3E1NGE8_9BACT|nr:hypothetical protein [Deminuibacter soli]RFM26911.1 hypothetical protein DXN05_18170 [Deminuibacter soli]
MRIIMIALCPCVLFLVMLTSCSRYIDKVNRGAETGVRNGFFIFYPDSNMLIYTSSVGLSRDTEKMSPEHFKVMLPKGIKYYEITNSTDFSVYYDGRQAIWIRIDFDKNLRRDTIYNPTQRELDSLLESRPIVQKSKYDITAKAFSVKRKSVLVKKDGAIILLYNIKPNKYGQFYKSVNSFSFIK